MKRLLVTILLSLAVGVLAFAGNSTSYIYVSGYNVPGISVEASSLNFGTFHIGQSSYSQTATITVNAPNTWNYHIALNAGFFYDGTYRNIASESNNSYKVPYWLYKPSFDAWGDSDYANTFSGGSSLAGTGSGADQVYTLTGWLFIPSYGPGYPVNDTYYDFVTVTVYY